MGTPENSGHMLVHATLVRSTRTTPNTFLCFLNVLFEIDMSF